MIICDYCKKKIKKNERVGICPHCGKMICEECVKKKDKNIEK